LSHTIEPGGDRGRGRPRQAAARYAFDLKYEAQPRWTTYSRLLKFCDILFQEFRDVKPRDCIDLQSFIWSIGDDSYKARPPEAKQPKS